MANAKKGAAKVPEVKRDYSKDAVLFTKTMDNRIPVSISNRTENLVFVFSPTVANTLLLVELLRRSPYIIVAYIDNKPTPEEAVLVNMIINWANGNPFLYDFVYYEKQAAAVLRKTVDGKFNELIHNEYVKVEWDNLFSPGLNVAGGEDKDPNPIIVHDVDIVYLNGNLGHSLDEFATNLHLAKADSNDLSPSVEYNNILEYVLGKYSKDILARVKAFEKKASK